MKTMKKAAIIIAILTALLAVSCDDTVRDLSVTVNWTLSQSAQSLLDASQNNGNAYFELEYGTIKNRIYVNEGYTWTVNNLAHSSYDVLVTLYDAYGNKIARSAVTPAAFEETTATLDLVVDQVTHRLTVYYGVVSGGVPACFYMDLFSGNYFYISENSYMSEAACREYYGKDGTFLGWFDDNGDQVTDLFTMPDHDVTLTARWR